MKAKFTLLLITLSISLCSFAQSKYVNLPEDLTDFSSISDFVDNATIVGMGESTHGTHEFFVSRTEMFKYLVKEHNFNTFFLEADYANCYPINDYIHGENGEVTSLVKNLALWPWMTTEMVELIEWMKSYNSEKLDRPISFIGVDMQQVEETLAGLVKVLGNNTPTSLDKVKSIEYDEFYNLKKSEVKKQFQPVIDDLDKLDISLLQQQSTEKYQLLVRHFKQIIEEKYSNNSVFRDFKMAENILHHLKLNSDLKGFYWAHNMHIAKFYIEKKKKGVAGGVLKKHLQDQYISLGQEFYEGSFNVYYNVAKGDMDDRDNYELGTVTVGPAPEGSLAYNFKKDYQFPLFIPFDQLPESEEVNISSIGAQYIIDDNPKSIWRYNHHGRDAFDAIILIDKSTPTQLIID